MATVTTGSITIGEVTYSLVPDAGNPDAFCILHTEGPGYSHDTQLGPDAQGRSNMRIVRPESGQIGVVVFEGPTQAYPAP